MEEWESDLLDVQNISKFNNNNYYLLRETDVLYKFLHVVPLKSKTGQTLTLAFQSTLLIRTILNQINNADQLCEQIRAKNFLTIVSKTCWSMRGYSYSSVKIPTWSVHWWNCPSPLHENFNKNFTFKNSYRYIDVLQKFVKAYNDTVHTTIGIALSKVTD